jgi:hypothetical protein
MPPVRDAPVAARPGHGRRPLGYSGPDPGGVRQPLPEPLVLRQGLRGQLHQADGRPGDAQLRPRTNYAWYGSLHLNDRFLTGPATQRKTACHEPGHVFGLCHRSGGRTCMRDGFASMYGHPDAGDHARLRAIYR